jgi:hypothetical protein
LFIEEGTLISMSYLIFIRLHLTYTNIVATKVHSGGPQLGFLIGTDTMVRILNPKYYGGNEDDMLEAVREMGRSGVHFVVGGRLEQHRPGEE